MVGTRRPPSYGPKSPTVWIEIEIKREKTRIKINDRWNCWDAIFVRRRCRRQKETTRDWLDGGAVPPDSPSQNADFLSRYRLKTHWGQALETHSPSAAESHTLRRRPENHREGQECRIFVVVQFQLGRPVRSTNGQVDISTWQRVAFFPALHFGGGDAVCGSLMECLYFLRPCFIFATYVFYNQSAIFVYESLTCVIYKYINQLNYLRLRTGNSWPAT